jgi:uncharacterized SAM-binding protein YcdF (DUF218 family)
VWKRRRRIALTFGAVLITALVALAVSGYVLFTRPHADPLRKADAIVVLGGDDDGRMQYGLELARQGYANTVLISDSYEPGDPGDLGDSVRQEYAKACASGTAATTVICFRPDPYTTRGEAMFVARTAAQHNWKHLIVVSWNYHIVRARFIFHQCFDGEVTMRPAQQVYDYTLDTWAQVYAYQFGALVKAAALGCDRG